MLYFFFYPSFSQKTADVLNFGNVGTVYLTRKQQGKIRKATDKPPWKCYNSILLIGKEIDLLILLWDSWSSS